MGRIENFQTQYVPCEGKKAIYVMTEMHDMTVAAVHIGSLLITKLLTDDKGYGEISTGTRPVYDLFYDEEPTDYDHAREIYDEKWSESIYVGMQDAPTSVGMEPVVRMLCDNIVYGDGDGNARKYLKILRKAGLNIKVPTVPKDGTWRLMIDRNYRVPDDMIRLKDTLGRYMVMHVEMKAHRYNEPVVSLARQMLEWNDIYGTEDRGFAIDDEDERINKLVALAEELMREFINGEERGEEWHWDNVLMCIRLCRMVGKQKWDKESLRQTYIESEEYNTSEGFDRYLKAFDSMGLAQVPRRNVTFDELILRCAMWSRE